MKTHVHITLAFVLVLGGCAKAQRLEVGVLADDGQTSDITPPPNPIPTPISKLLSSVLPPPPTATKAIVLHFKYPCALTNGFIEDSTDLVHWQLRTDFIVNDATTWTVRLDPTKPMEFFRAGGEVIGE